MAIKKKECKDCKKVYTKKTLDKYKGRCFKCNNIKYSDKCKDCNKVYTKKTLEKYNGICGKCNSKKLTSKYSKKYNTIKLNNKCKKCNKVYTKKTLEKYNGICGKCNKTNGKMSSKNKLLIPKKIKEECWRKYIGNTLDGNCYTCLCIIYFGNFQAGHIQSEYDSGKITIINLRPICKPCNVSCGVMNLNDFKNKIQC